MNKLKRLYLTFKLYFYNLVLIFEEFVDKLNGRKSEHIPLDEIREVQELNNTKLRAALRKLRKKIYEYDEVTEKYVLKDFAKQKDFDLVSLLNEEPLSTREKMKVARLQARVLENPTDHSGTEDAMVQHNVKNARRYELERERRNLAKERQAALRDDEAAKAKELSRKINLLSGEIERLKNETA